MLQFFQSPVYCRVELVRNLMAHAQKPHFVFLRNGRVHLNRRGSQFSRLLAAEVCASALSNAGYTPFRGRVRVQTPFAISPSLPLPCVTVCHHIPNAFYHVEENVTHKVNYHYCCHFPSLELIQLPERVEGLPSEGRGDGRILK